MIIDNTRNLTIPEPGMVARRLKIAICVPSMDRVHADFMTSMVGMIATSVTNAPVDCYMINHQNSVITDARNKLVQLSLDWGADWLLWLDSDLSFPPDTLIRLLNRQLDIVGSTYCQRAHPYAIMGNFVEKLEDYSGVALAETEYLPGGLVLVRGDVYRKIPGPWYEDFYNYETQNLAKAAKEWAAGTIDKDAFQKVIAAYEAAVPVDRIGEDIDFCRKVRAAGYRVWCDVELTENVTHIGQLHVRAQLPGRQVAQGPNLFVPGQQGQQPQGATIEKASV